MKKLIVFLLIAALILSSCQVSTKPKQPKTKESAESIADKFGRYWEQKDYSAMYDQFIPELQKLKTKDDFIKLMSYIERDSNVVVRLDKISMDSDDTAYAYYTLSSSLINSKAPAMKLKYTNGEWRVDAFSSYFSTDLEEKKYLDMTKLFIESKKKDLEQINFIIKNKIIIDEPDRCTDYLKDEDKISFSDFLNQTPPESLKDLRARMGSLLNYSVQSEFNVFLSCITMRTFLLSKKQEHSDEVLKYSKEVITNLEKAQIELIYIDQYIKNRDI